MNVILQKGYAQFMQDTVEPALETIRNEIQVKIKDGNIRVEHFAPEGAERVLLLLHGFTESSVKFREMIWYFTQAGFEVFAPDQRGHGKSLRLVDNPSLVHVEQFDDYVTDAQAVLKQAILPVLSGRPLSLFCHSMGGAVGAFLLARENRFETAVLSSPMIAPSSGNIPMWIGRELARSQVLLGRGKRMAFIASDYDAAKDTFEASCDTCRERFDYYKAKRMKEQALMTNGPSYRWVLESIGVTKKLLSPEVAGRISARVLLCQAGKDTVVTLPEQDAFVSKLLLGKKAVFPNAKHEIYFSEDEDMQHYVPLVIGFLKTGEAEEKEQ